MKRILLSFFLCIYTFNLNAQKVNKIATIKNFGKEIKLPNQQLTPSGHVRCATDENEAYLQAQYPNRATTEQFEAWLKPKIEKIKADRRAGRNIQQVYNIPVVIHIVHNGDALGTGENITDAQAISQINVMNEDFRRLAGTPGGANTTGLAVDCEINFCLARTDPNGNPTTGVVRHVITPYSNNVADGSGGPDWETRADTEAMKAATIWNPDNYLNMWTIRPGGLSINSGGQQGLLGYAQFPSNSGLGGLNTDGGAGNTDGVVAAFDAMGTIAQNDGTFILNATYNLGRTMTHEVGHWVGLRHIWGDNSNCTISAGDAGQDYCPDTPAANTPNYTCNLSANSCTADPGNDMVQNYMDYTNDACMDTFTQNQKDRMIAVMQNSPRRNTLNASIACQAPAPYIQFGNPTGSVIEGTGCNFTDYNFPITILKAASANATINFNIAGGSATQNVDYVLVNPIVTFPVGTTAPQNLTVRVFNDGIVEADETIIVNFTVNSNGGDAVLNPSGNSMSITIANNDNTPTATQTVTVLSQDFEAFNGWTTLDADGDGRSWGLVNGLDGAGTGGNFISGRAAYSEKRLNYLGGSGNANPNNYFRSPQITIPSGASAVNLSFIVYGYDNGAQTRNAGNYSVYFTTSITNEAAILAGTLIQANAVVNESTSELKTYNLLALAGQTGYLVFRHNNTSNTNVGLLVVDTVRLTAVVETPVQTEVNNTTLYQALLQTSGNVYATDAVSGNIMTRIQNNTTFDYGCTTVEVTSSQTSVGSATKLFIDNNSSNNILAKSYFINSINDTPSGNYNVSFYFTEAEIAAWESATGKSRTELQIIKVINENINAVNYSNYDTFKIEEVPISISAFGTNVVLSGTFSSNLKGGYAIGPKSGINCGDFTTTWNGTTWSNGVPKKNVAVTIAGNYSSVGDIEACSLTINSGVNVTVNAGHTFIVDGPVTVNGTGSLTIENNGALRQLDDTAINAGNIIVKRNSTPMIRQDYTAWSSPVAGQQLLAFSPNTVPTRFYEYLYTGTTTSTAYQSVDSNTNFTTGKGYMIRVDNTWSSTIPTVYNGEFSGIPNNGIVNQAIGFEFNLLGNPYASPISGLQFLNDNPNVSTLYFWTHTAAAVSGSYPQNNYASFTSLGGAAAAAGGTTPNGIIQTGQGFYIRKTTLGNGSVSFNNAQRLNATASTQFYRMANEVQKHRIWLNLNDAVNSYNQILIGYVDGATNAFDNMIDGRIFDQSNTMLYSLINNDEYVIQGKGLPFEDTDNVALGLKAELSGSYTISLEALDGLFATQNIYLRDAYTNTLHDIKQSPYEFSSQIGTFNDRFSIVYRESTLDTSTFVNDASIIVYSQEQSIVIDSGKEMIKKVSILDVLGRTLFESPSLNQNTFDVTSLVSTNQALFVRVTLTNGQVINKKIIF